MIQNANRITRFAFPQVKTAVDFINRLEGRVLMEDLKYNTAIYFIRKFGIYSFSLGGSEHFIQELAIQGSYSISEKRRGNLSGVDLANIIDENSDKSGELSIEDQAALLEVELSADLRVVGKNVQDRATVYRGRYEARFREGENDWQLLSPQV